MTEVAQVTRVAAYGLLVRDQQILLCRNSAQLPAHAGRWTLPGGGLEFGEHPQAAVVRELREETGLAVRTGDLATVDAIEVTVDQTRYHSIRIIYHAHVIGGELTNEVDGSTDMAQWWPVAAPPELVDLAELGVALAQGAEASHG